MNVLNERGARFYHSEQPPPNLPRAILLRLESIKRLETQTQHYRGSVCYRGAHAFANDRRAGRWRVVNPSSAGVPLDGTFVARYLLLESTGDGWQPTFRHVPLDNARVLEAFEQRKFIERCGVIGQNRSFNQKPGFFEKPGF